MHPLVGEAAHALGLVPIVAVAVQWLRGVKLDPAAFWMALAFAVSFVADCFPHRYASQVYPVTQAAIFAAVLLPSHKGVERLVALILCAAAISILARNAAGLDVMLHVISWGAISALAWMQMPNGVLRTCLTLGFGLGAIAWVGFVAYPTFGWWGAYQVTRLIAVGGFVYAVRAR